MVTMCTSSPCDAPGISRVATLVTQGRPPAHPTEAVATLVTQGRPPAHPTDTPTGAPPHALGAPPSTPARPHGRRLTEGSLLGFPSGKRLRASLSSWYPFSVKTSAVCSGQGTTILADGIFCLKGGFLSLYIMWSMSVLLTLPSSCSRFVSDCLEASRSARVLKISSRHRKKRNRLNLH